MSATAATTAPITITSAAPSCAHCHQPLNRQADDTGFGYSRDLDTDPDPAAVPDGVELVPLTGRTPRRAA